MLWNKNKEKVPFDFLFKKISPKDFCSYFRYEQIQCLAYILSFCKSKRYVAEVLSFFDNNLEQRQAIINYFKICKEHIVNKEFLHELEDFVQEFVAQYNYSNLKFFRSRIDDFIPKKIKNELKLNAELEESIKFSCDKIDEVISLVSKYCTERIEVLKNINRRLEHMQDSYKKSKEEILKESSGGALSQKELYDLLGAIENPDKEKSVVVNEIANKLVTT